MRGNVGEFFESIYGFPASHFSFAPGRINLIGEHTDYSEGFVMPMAIGEGITIAARPNGTRQIRLISEQLGRARSIELDEANWAHPDDWSVYPSAMAKVMAFTTGLDVAIVSDLPVAGGVSSSAALEMAFAVLYNSFGGNRSMLELAILAREAETNLVGVPCGIMDMLASALGREGHAMMVDTRSLDIEYVSIPARYRIFLAGTGKPRELSDSAYRSRSEECAEAARQLRVPFLRDAEEMGFERLTDPTLMKRARHVVTENKRVFDFREALRMEQSTRLGQILAESQRSLREDFDVSCQELDVMVESCLKVPGCVGARMTGAGFGGGCVAIFESRRLGAIGPEIEQMYLSRVKKYRPTVKECRAAGGAGIRKNPSD